VNSSDSDFIGILVADQEIFITAHVVSYKVTTAMIVVEKSSYACMTHPIGRLINYIIRVTYSIFENVSLYFYCLDLSLHEQYTVSKFKTLYEFL